MEIAIREHSHPGDLSTIVDKDPIAPRCQIKTGRRESTQVRHEAVLPKKPVHRTASTGEGNSYDLPPGVDVKCDTAIITAKGSEVSHDAILPEKGELGLIVFVGGPADNFPGAIDPFSNSVTPAKCAQVSEHSTAPEEGVSLTRVWKED
jgi:hypothetical protein